MDLDFDVDEECISGALEPDDDEILPSRSAKQGSHDIGDSHMMLVLDMQQALGGNDKVDLWTYLRALRKLPSDQAFSQFKADLTSRTFPGDRDGELMAAGYILTKLREQARAMSVGWGRPVPQAFNNSMEWLLKWYPILQSPDTAAPHAKMLNTAEFPNAQNIEKVQHPGSSKLNKLEKRQPGQTWIQTDAAKTNILALPELLQEKVKGQKNAVSRISDMLLPCFAGLREPRGPLGTVLFVGPTGVGKTELAKSLANALFGSELIFRVDMSAFKAKGDISTLIGAPRGYTDSDKGGTLTAFFKQLRKRNCGAVVLLDEMEKAHPEVVELFLPAFDEGYIVDGRGARHDCKDVLFIMTSNLGSRAIGDRMKQCKAEADLGIDQVEEIVLPHVQQHLPPELLGRVDEIICFMPLGPAVIREILEMQMQQLQLRLIALTHGACSLCWNEFVADFVLQHSGSSEYGARGIKRSLQHLVAVPLAKLLLASPSRELPKGSCLNIAVDRGSLEFTFEVASRL